MYIIHADYKDISTKIKLLDNNYYDVLSTYELVFCIIFKIILLIDIICQVYSLSASSEYVFVVPRRLFMIY